MGQSLADRALEIAAGQRTRREDLGIFSVDTFAWKAKYIGQVATRTTVCIVGAAGVAWQNVRSMHWMRDDVSAVKLALPGFYVDASTHQELGVGGATAVTASVEYPAGVFTQVRFAGTTSGTIPNGGMLWSDPVAVIIPRGAQFWVRTFSHCAAGGMYRGPSMQYTAAGELFEYSADASPLSDKTMGGTISAVDTANMGCQPVAIVGLTNRPSVLIIGDSVAAGINDTYSGDGDVGLFARSIGPVYAYGSLASGGDSAVLWNASHANRAALAAYFSHAVIDYGINDYNTGSSDATIRASINSVVASLPATQVKYISTLPPNTSSTDSWATLGNQTVSIYEATRLGNNAWRRAVPAGFSAAFDLATLLELTAGKWPVNGAANKWTSDGIHPSVFGYQQIAASGVISTAIMTV